MRIYLGSQAKFMFKDDDIPVNSIGVFKSWASDDWVYWYSDRFLYDVGDAKTESKALSKAIKNLRWKRGSQTQS